MVQSKSRDYGNPGFPFFNANHGQEETTSTEAQIEGGFMPFYSQEGDGEKAELEQIQEKFENEKDLAESSESETEKVEEETEPTDLSEADLELWKHK